jgi:hypothetical protein
VAAFTFEFTDSGKCFTLLVRRGVGELIERRLAEPYLSIRTTERHFKRGMVAGEFSRYTRQYWQGLELIVPGAAAIAPFRKLRRLAQFGRMMGKP